MNKSTNNITLVFKPAAANSIHKMPVKRISIFGSRCNSAFSHHGVRIANAKFGSKHHLSTILTSDYCGTYTTTTTTDNQYIDIIINFI
ncbi:hypothetical protein SDC9_179687 [bioreactor metagenome]|uniref:Uncharacterized protein n=1 Tax=bioreactor metagenome TaxID=1076179 RepID=A0A645GZH1_9ZZZZ